MRNLELREAIERAFYSSQSSLWSFKNIGLWVGRRKLPVYAEGAIFITFLITLELLFKALTDGEFWNLGVAGSLVLSFTLVVVFSSVVYWRGIHYLPVKTITPQGEPQPKKVVILLVSLLREKPQFELKGEDTVWLKVRSALQDGTEVMRSVGAIASSEYLSKNRWSWQQQFRALIPHINEVERVYLLGSFSEERQEAPIEGRDVSEQDWSSMSGSVSQISHCAELIELLEPRLKGKVQQINAAPRFENVEAVYEVLVDQVDRIVLEGYGHNDMIIDITGGQKPTSLAGALVTMSRPQLQFQYVDTDSESTVHSYNMTIQSAPDFG